MHRLAICALFLLLLFFSFSACSTEQPAQERLLELREMFQGADQRFFAHITADYGDRVYHFTLRFDSAQRTLEVLDPEIIAGVIIGISEGGTTLHFEGAELDTGPLTEDGLSPMAALPVIVLQWKEGHITDAHYETVNGTNAVVMTTQISDSVRHTTWFDRETGIPMKAEILSDGFAVIHCVFEGSPLLLGEQTTDKRAG